jgi:tetratricopeptide (TPR) repeat protein
MGDYYVQLAQDQSDSVEKEADLRKAIDYYQQAVKVAKSTENQAKIGYLVSLGNIYVELASEDPTKLDPELLLQSINFYQAAVDAKPGLNDLYRIEEQIARLYYQLAEKNNALRHVNAALAAAPEDQKESLNAFLSKIQSLP